MTLFLLRTGSIRRCAVVPDGLACMTYTDRHQRRIHVLLNSDSERILLQAQPPRTGRLPRAGRRASRAAAAPLAA